MISKNQMKFIKSLYVKKFRDREGLFFAEGVKIVTELISSGLKIHSLYFTSEWEEEIVKHKNTINAIKISNVDLKKISLLENPNKVFAVAHIPARKLELKNLKDTFTLILDHIQDPGNLGTIIRTAEWFGIKNIICSEETVDAYNPKVIQSSMGSLFRTNIFHLKLKEVLKQIKNEIKIPVYGALLDGENILNKKLNPKSFLLMGSESKGISKELLPFIDERISIKKSGQSYAESLNVAVAASILCYQFLRDEKE